MLPSKRPPAARLLAVLIAAGAFSSAAEASDAQRGRMFATTHCAHCHNIERSGTSPFRAAPPLRILHKKYPIESLQEAFAEGISTGHPQMPPFRLDPGTIGDLIAYLKTLE